MVKAKDQAELLNCQKQAQKMDINNFMIEEVDQKTGQTIYPIVAIGPDRKSKINVITQHLKLL